jgi:predicted enzyme related to lactoylglutathione lyase
MRHEEERQVRKDDDMILGLATAIYHVSDLARAKAWYAGVFGVQPYFDEPFYVGFNVGGYELGLNPDAKVVQPGPGGTIAYWRVPDIDAAFARFTAAGAAVKTPVQDVGGGIRTADLADPDGNLLGLIENPHFALPSP